MSLAKNKKIQAILAQGSSSDSEEDGNGGVFTEFSTMKQKTNKKKASKKPPPSTTADSTTPAKTINEKKEAEPAKKASSKPTNPPSKTGGAAPRADRKKEAQKKKREAELEDERMLDNILSAQTDGVDPLSSETTPSPNGEVIDIQALLYTADRKYLDYRHEQAESFGKHAMEDLTGKNLKRLGYVVPKIAKTPFSTPNLGNGTWSVLTKAEGAAELVPMKDTSKPVDFSVNNESPEYLKAHHALQFAIETSLGNTEALIKTWQANPHHLPTVLQLASTFQVLGDVSKVAEFMDIALHLVGNLFSSSRGFSMFDLPSKRRIPFIFSPNKPIFTALSRGIHHVLQKSYTKTAHEICKVLLSLDETDPCGAGLLWDYTAVRAREYMSVVELHHAIVASVLRGSAPSPPGPLAQPFVGLPSLHFSSALCRHVLHTTNVRSATSSSTGGSTTIKGNRTPLSKCNTELLVRSGTAESPAGSGGQFPHGGLFPVCGTVTARDAAIAAVALFPQAALDLAAAAGEPITEEPWSSLSFEVEDLKQASAVFAARAESPLNHLFALRHGELWKPVDRLGLLRDAVKEVNRVGLVSALHNGEQQTVPAAARSEGPSTDAGKPSVGLLRELLSVIDEQSPVLEGRYGSLPEHFLTGKMDGAIPRELLEAMRAEDEQQAMGGHVERLSEQDMMLLQRYEAAFGPIEVPGADHMLPSERLAFYSAQLEDHIRQLGSTYNPISLFFRTILPWNDVREMALRTAFQNANTEDPEIVARRVRREYERQVMDDADAQHEEGDAPNDQNR